VDRRLPLGAVYLGRERSSFVVWSPGSEVVDVRILAPRTRTVRLQRGANGYHHRILEGIEPGTLYVYRLDGLIERPDPASRCQPHGPSGPSCVTDPRFAWRDSRWPGLPLTDYIIHEDSEHIAPFHDFIPGLSRLRDLGATVLSVRLDAPPHLRPSGLPYSVPTSLGGPVGLKRLVNGCHRRGLAIMLRTSLFKLGIEGDPFVSFGPYFRDRIMNLDGPLSDEVRRYVVECALQWFREFHVDALDVGDVDCLADISPMPLLEELTCLIRDEAIRIGRPLYLVAQSERNDPRLIRLREDGGIGLDALWNQDFCLALQEFLSRKRKSPLHDFGKLQHLKKAFLEGFVCSGEFSPSRQRRHGQSSRNLPGDRFLVSCLTPSGPGQRTEAAMEEQKLVGAALFFSPFIPLLCIEGVEVVRSVSGLGMGPFHCELVRLRKELRSLGLLDKQCMGILGYEKEKVLLARYWKEDEDLIVLFNVSRKATVVPLPIPAGPWLLRFNSADKRWKGPGNLLPYMMKGGDADIPLTLAALSCAVFMRQRGG
jgi:maltooligosyltrehalose trehalohydrolase